MLCEGVFWGWVCQVMGCFGVLCVQWRGVLGQVCEVKECFGVLCVKWSVLGSRVLSEGVY